ncbi:uncharacterized protein FIBRA_02294 [Fibroporia radiculosa]|uniref:PAS domain-containing protein n=1 Tax=Fibroporia radiculosa TaxID=599839 RepID=J4H1S1_9APHY|nr:uncharacterized protein FIBRA_02294 [Fibroporia radiculosa]CCM00264.1 predicted protein [Fibroporia radiculosa]
MLPSQSQQEDVPPMSASMTQQPLPPYHMPSTSSSEHNTPDIDPKKKLHVKRKRPQDAASDSAESASHPPRTREGPKKKKANRACFHCQKAHLTCDDYNCTEGHRKKAKYLLDEEELEAMKRNKSGEGSSKGADSAPIPQSQPDSQYVQPDPMFSSYPVSSFSMTSEGANLEYSILSAILGNSPEASGAATGSPAASQAPSSSYPAPTPGANLVAATWPTDPYAATPQSASGNGYVTGSAGFQEHTPLAIQPPDAAMPSASNPPSALSPNFIAGDSRGFPPVSQFGQVQGHPPAVTVPQTQLSYTDYPPPTSTQSTPPSTSTGQRFPSYPQRAQTVGASIPGAMRPERGAAWANQVSLGVGSGMPPIAQSGAGVYQAVTKPYDYTEGYHFLMKHLPTRFDKNDILRIVRALAIFRPSLIALQMPLSEEDEVFVEKCFQRSLIELDKLVSFSGTPTVAWRRTGEICLVGPEFYMLTGWEKEELVGRRKYIYEASYLGYVPSDSTFIPSTTAV